MHWIRTHSAASRWALLLTSLILSTPSLASEARPIPSISRAIVISIDGLRPDLLLRAKAPALRRLMDRGSYTLWARTTAASVTMPSHTSMLTGVIPARHRVEWNSDLPFTDPVYPAKPTLFKLAHGTGYSTAMAVGKSKLGILAVPGTLDRSFVPSQPVADDEEVTAAALRWIDTNAPGVLFIHLAGVDVVGHDRGWGSAEQLEAVARADRCIARLLNSYQRARLLDSTLVLVSADHGGAGRSHGPDDPRSRTIPWILAGPGIRKNHDLTQDPELEIRTEDTFATVCWLLGIPMPEPVDGHPVRQVLADPERR